MQDFSIQCKPNADFSVVELPQRKMLDMPFIPPPENPTVPAVDGILFDFNNGLRVRFPDTGEFRCVFRDLDTDCLLYCMDVKPGCTIESVKKFFIRFSLEIYRKGELGQPIFRHDLNLSGKDVLIQLPAGALGDSIAWFSYVERFLNKHRCKLFCSMEPRMAELFKDQYPEISFITKEEAAKLKPYATYNLGLFFGGDSDHQPFDFRAVGLHRTAGLLLGLEDDELGDDPPRVNLSAPRQIREKYVCIASQASSQCKYWNNPSGWREVVAFLKEQGYRVLCIDRMPEYGSDYVWNHIPYGSEDFTGDRPLHIGANHILNEGDVPEEVQEQPDLFADHEALAKQKAAEDAELVKERRLQDALLSIKKQFGKNAVLKAMSLQEGATAKDRNQQVGGHKA